MIRDINASVDHSKQTTDIHRNKRNNTIANSELTHQISNRQTNSQIERQTDRQTHTDKVV